MKLFKVFEINFSVIFLIDFFDKILHSKPIASPPLLFKKVVTVSIFSIDLPRITILTPELERLKAIELPKIPVPPVMSKAGTEKGR